MTLFDNIFDPPNPDARLSVWEDGAFRALPWSDVVHAGERAAAGLRAWLTTAEAAAAGITPKRYMRIHRGVGTIYKNWFLPGLAAPALYADCSDTDVARALSLLRPQSMASFSQSPRAVAWRDTPTTYVVCGADRGHTARGSRRGRTATGRRRDQWRRQWARQEGQKEGKESRGAPR